MSVIKQGKLIYNRRKQLNLTQTELGKKVGVSDKTISKWELGNTSVPIKKVSLLCQALNISEAELINGEIHNIDNSCRNAKKFMLVRKINLVIIIILSIVCLLQLIYIFNNFNKYQLYTIGSSNENFKIVGNVVINPDCDVININQIQMLNNSNKQAYYLDYTLFINGNRILQKNNVEMYIYEENDEITELNTLLNDIRLYIEDDNEYNEYAVSETDMNSWTLKLRYVDENQKIVSLEIPLTIKLQTANNKIF